MSRAHERTYRLLAERVPLATWARRTLYVVIAAAIGTGIEWLLVHYAWLPDAADELQRVSQEALAMKLHGAVAFVLLMALGALSSNHMRRGWASARNRVGGAALVLLFAVLVVTGYALYYLVSEESRPAVSLLHWALGLALAPLVVVHIFLGRRTRPRPSADAGSHP
jgi:predicted permease